MVILRKKTRTLDRATRATVLSIILNRLGGVSVEPDGRLLSSHTEDKALSRTTLADTAYAAIRDAILSRQITAGTHLKQLKLARELGVDQGAIREALARLVAKGLATHKPNRGVRVARLDHQEIEDLYRVRQLLEPLTMEAAAAHITERELAELHDILPRSGDDPLANWKFHWTAIKASRRVQLINFLTQAWEISLPYVLRETIDTETVSSAVNLDHEHHATLLAALERGDGAEAARISAMHVQKSLEGIISRWSLADSRPARSAESGAWREQSSDGLSV